LLQECGQFVAQSGRLPGAVEPGPSRAALWVARVMAAQMGGRERNPSPCVVAEK
jgi:hypothetical protein